MSNIQQELTEQLIKELRTAFLAKQNYKLYQIGSIDLLETALQGTGYYLDIDEMNTNGWEQDWWTKIVDEKTNQVVAKANGSMYYGYLEFNFINNED